MKTDNVGYIKLLKADKVRYIKLLKAKPVLNILVDILGRVQHHRP